MPWGHKYIGQTQKWFAFQFTGEASDINVGTVNPEFSEWKWTKIKLIVDEIVPFKRDVYSKILIEFKDLFEYKIVPPTIIAKTIIIKKIIRKFNSCIFNLCIEMN